MVQICIEQSQEGGRLQFEKPLNLHITANIQPILLKSGMLTHIQPLQWTDH